MTGASGAPYAIRLLQVLAATDAEIHLTISPSGAAVIRQEMGITVDLHELDLTQLLTAKPTWSRREVNQNLVVTPERLQYHRHDDFMTPIASGSFRTDAMVVCPCSGTTLSAISRSAAENLVSRAAEVHLKEHRKLVLVPRETPMSVLQLENLHRVAQAGAVVLPAMPGWYHDVRTLDDLVDFVVARILDQLDLDNSLIRRWGQS